MAKECSIVSKGAAYIPREASRVIDVSDNAYSAKRYERLMKAHGIHQSCSATGEDSPADTSTRPPGSNTTTPAKSAKKRKLNQFTAINSNTDDDEGLKRVKLETPRKLRKPSLGGAAKLHVGIKEEYENAPELDDVDEESMVKDFVAFDG